MTRECYPKTVSEHRQAAVVRAAGHPTQGKAKNQIAEPDARLHRSHRSPPLLPTHTLMQSFSLLRHRPPRQPKTPIPYLAHSQVPTRTSTAPRYGIQPLRTSSQTERPEAVDSGRTQLSCDRYFYTNEHRNHVRIQRIVFTSPASVINDTERAPVAQNKPKKKKDANSPLFADSARPRSINENSTVTLFAYPL